MSRFESKYAVCPYYQNNDGRKIRCEGVSRQNTIYLAFHRKEKALRYEKRYCDSIEGCKECRLYQMLEKKWEDKKSE